MVAPVIVGIDGSEQSLAAVRVAALQARRRGLPLRVVHAFIWPSLHVGVGPVADDMPGTGLRHQAEDLLAEAVAVAGDAAPGLAVSSALVDGAATPVLLHESRDGSLLVLGDRGLGGVSGLIIGSVAVHASAHAHCPVLVVRGDEHPGGPVVVGVDGSEGSRLAVAAAYEQSAFLGAELVAVLAGDDSPGARLLLGEALAGWGERYPDVTVRTEAVRENARHALVERSKTARLVVVGARGRDTFKGLVLGSVSQALLHHAACPVEVVRAAAVLREEGEPSDNVDVFVDRPADAVSGLVPDRQSMAELLEDLRAAGVDVSGVTVLHGPEGVRILDSDGSRHGWHARFVRFFQNWGYDDAILNLYDEGLRKGEVAFMIPAAPDERHEIARLVRQRRGHAVHYFGPERAESLSGP
ncbi:universal stress protein [Actinoplanes sp. CA-131856]